MSPAFFDLQHSGMVWFAPWDMLARAEMTLTIAHGARRLATRVLLADGRILEQINAGVPDLENDWTEIDRFTDLEVAMSSLRRDGWTVHRRGARRVASRKRG